MKTTRIATLNVCGLSNKTPELIEFMTKKHIDILGIADTRKKGGNIQKTIQNYVLIWSGVDNTLKAKYGVGFLVNPNKAKYITDIEYISERIIRIQLIEEERTTTLNPNIRTLQ